MLQYVMLQILTPFMLRRLKTDVELVLPPKREIMVYAPLMPKQQEFYKKTVEKTIAELVESKTVNTSHIYLGCGSHYRHYFMIA